MEQGEEGPIEDASATTLLANVASGRSGVAATARLEQMVRERSLKMAVLPVAGAALAGEVRRLVASGARRIAVAGGDGSLTTAANELAGSGVTLAPIPIGTLNHFSRRIGIERPEGGLDAIESGEPQGVPVGILDDQVFLNTTTVGIYAELVERRERLRPILFKWPAALAALVSLLPRMRRVEVDLHVDDMDLHRDTPLVWVGVGWGSFPRVHQSPEQRRSPDLEVVIVKARTRWAVLVLLARVARGLLRRERPFTDPALEIHHTRSVVIRAPGRVGVTVDGEVSYRQPPLFLAVQDDGLLVQAPASE